MRRAGELVSETGRAVGRMAVGARYVIAPVLASFVVVVFFLTGVAPQA